MAYKVICIFEFLRILTS